MTREELTLDMMDKMPELGGRSHGGGEGNSQARRQALQGSAYFLVSPKLNTENEKTAARLAQEKPCPARGPSDKDWRNSMPFRSFSYWFVSSIAAVIAVGAAEPEKATTLDLSLPGNAVSTLLPVPEPSRAFLLFAGVMAMAFTYRCAWLSWKRRVQS